MKIGTALYTRRLKSLGISDTYIHSTRLRETLIHYIEGLKDMKKSFSNQHELIFDSDISAVVSQLEEMRNDNEDFFILSKATKILRRYALLQKNEFKGTFPQDCQVSSVQPVYLNLFQELIDQIYQQIGNVSYEMVKT